MRKEFSVSNYDWNAIKTEYITTTISYRKLANKHEIPFRTLQQRATKDKWVEAKKKHNAKIVSKSVKKAETKAIDYKSTLYSLAYKVAKQLNDMTEQNSISELAVMGIKPRDITGAIKDLEDALHVKSEADLREQEARIEKLRKEAQAEQESKDIKVIISSELDEYSE